MSFENGCFRFQDKISIHFTLLSNDPSSIPVQRWQARRKRKRDADDTFPPSPSTPDGAGGADDLTNSLPRKRPRCCCRGRERCAQKVGQFFSVFFFQWKVAETKNMPLFLKGGGNMAAIKPVPNTVRVKLVPCWVFCGCDSAREWFCSTSETNRTSLGCSWDSCSLSNFNSSFWLQVTNKFDNWIQSLDHEEDLKMFFGKIYPS